MKSPAVKSDDDWQTDSDVRTLTEAEKIKADKKRHGKAKARAAQMVEQMKSVTGEGAETSEGDGDADDKK